MIKKKQIIAIGGGGFSRYGKYSPESFLMERYLLDQTGKDRPKICFIPTASGEAHKYVIDFYRAFVSLGAIPIHLSFFELPTNNLESFIMEQDAIYVGGGNTKSMLALWKEWKLDVILHKAWHAGIVLGGSSAGSICWFQEGVTDSIPGNLTHLNALGFLPGSNCPHYDGEKERRPAYHKMLKEKVIKPGLAIDDRVAVHFVDDTVVNVIKENQTANAYFVSLQGNEIVENPIVIEKNL